MAEIIEKAALYLMSEKCYDNYFVDHNFFDGMLIFTDCDIFLYLYFLVSYPP